ncbi:DUF2441 domain-containing protein [Salmonella enterica subsp. enterica]|nr:DUF2441 domain-containing protein [Salmonella enterica subsp. enterica]HAU2964001.1 DUF2441 domain-containing protein [Salmonella enterica subsp. diarizonae]
MVGTIYYTADTQRTLRPFCKIGMQNYKPEKEELANFLNQLFPKGISCHGYNYIYNPEPEMSKNDINSLSLLVGLIWELVRLAHFPDKPSRYQCLFATESVEDAMAFIKSQDYRDGTDGAPIYEVVTTASVHRGDMRLLNADCSVLELYRRAFLYWSGKTEFIDDEFPVLWEILVPLPSIIGKRVI